MTGRAEVLPCPSSGRRRLPPPRRKERRLPKCLLRTTDPTRSTTPRSTRTSRRGRSSRTRETFSSAIRTPAPGPWPQIESSPETWDRHRAQRRDASSPSTASTPRSSGQAAPSAPAAPAVEAFVAQAHRTAPAQLPGIPEEGEPAWIEEGEPAWIEEAAPAWIEEAEPGFLTEESSSEHGASRAGGNKRGRRRALVAAGFITLAVIVGAGLGAMALNRSDDPRRNADTGSESTTTTPSTTTVATTPAAPETSAPPTT